MEFKLVPFEDVYFQHAAAKGNANATCGAADVRGVRVGGAASSSSSGAGAGSVRGGATVVGKGKGGGGGSKKE